MRCVNEKLKLSPKISNQINQKKKIKKIRQINKRSQRMKILLRQTKKKPIKEVDGR